MKPKKHEQEAKRLEALKSLNLLDTLPESEFNDIVFLASQICQTPMALFTLVDEDRQWFKAKVGFDKDQTDRDVSFCSHAINSTDSFFIVPDARQDERFAQNPLVLENPQISFYAAVVVSDPVTQLPIGTICTLDCRPRELSQMQLDALRALKNQVQIILKNRIEHAALLESQEKIQEINQRKDLILEMSGLGSWEFDLRSQFLTWSTQHYRIFEITEPQSQEQLYAQYRSRIHPDDIEELDRHIQGAIESGKNFTYNHRVYLNEGKRIKYVQGIGRVIKDISGVPVSVMGTCQDITEKYQAEKAIEESRLKAAQAAKLASIGEVAAGIAHEINNPLAIISGTIALLDRYVHDEAKLKSKVETITKSIQRITKIVSGLKKISRSYERQDFKNNVISDIVHEVLVITEMRSNSFSVEVTANIQTSAVTFCDALEIEQVLVNLINNAIDAVKNNSEKWVRINLFEEGSKIVLQVVDSGSGISPAVEAKLFQPFFTTKPVGEGTGLGLSICKGIMDNHKADFFLNREFSNTCFELRFNRVESEQSVA